MARKHVWKAFLQHTSFKGVSNVYKAKTKTQKILWAIGAMFGLIFGSFVVYSLLYSFFSYGHVVSETEVRTSGDHFPDITVCNLNLVPSDQAIPGSNLTFEEYLQNVNNSLNHNKELFNMNVSEHTIATLLTMKGYLQNQNNSFLQGNGSEIVMICVYKTTDGTYIPCQHGDGYELTQNALQYQKCVTFHPNNIMGSSHGSGVYGLQAMIYLNDFTTSTINDIWVGVHETNARGAKVFLHQPGTLANALLAPGITISPGQETTIVYETTLRTLLGHPYGDPCQEVSNLPKELGGENYLYERQTCYEIAKQAHGIKMCDCILPWVLFTKEQKIKYKFCGKWYENLTETMKNLQCAEQSFGSLYFDYDLQLKCPMSCTEYTYTSQAYTIPWPHEAYHLSYYKSFIKGKSFEKRFKLYEEIDDIIKVDKERGFERLRGTDLIRRNFLNLNVRAKTPGLLRHVSDQPNMTVFDLFGTLGGAFNLWMGITFLTAIEVLDLMYQLTVAKDKPEKRRQKNMTDGDHLV